MSVAARRFPPPWTVVETPGGWQVIDATGFPVAYGAAHRTALAAIVESGPRRSTASCAGAS